MCSKMYLQILFMTIAYYNMCFLLFNEMSPFKLFLGECVANPKIYMNSDFLCVKMDVLLYTPK